MELYDKNEKLTNKGLDLLTEIGKEIEKIMIKWRRYNCSVREMAHIANGAICDVECKMMLTNR